jgi:DNA polymerase III sliding clamp (beta) subunit (PCNA family)
VRLEFTDINKALTLKPQPEEGYLNIVMPMQLD